MRKIQGRSTRPPKAAPSLQEQLHESQIEIRPLPSIIRKPSEQQGITDPIGL